MSENSNQIILPKEVEEQLQQYNIGDNVSNVVEAGAKVVEVVGKEVGEGVIEIVIETAFEGVCDVVGGVFGAIFE